MHQAQARFCLDIIKFESRLRNFLRFLLLLAGGVLLAIVIFDYTASRLSNFDISADLLPELPEGISAQAQQWKWTQTAGESTHIEVQAQGFVQDASDSHTDLHGVVLRIFHEGQSEYDLINSAAMRLQGDGQLLSEGSTTITIGIPQEEKGSSRVIANTTGVVFQPEDNLAHTSKEVLYFFEGGTGRSLGAVYEAITGMLQMKKEVELEWEGDSPDQRSVRLRAGQLRYFGNEDRIELAGGARLEHGEQWLDCREGTVWLKDGRISRMEALGTVGGQLVTDEEVRFETPQLKLFFNADGQLEHAVGEGESVFTSDMSGQHTSIQGGLMELFYESDSTGQVSELRQIDVHESAQAQMNLEQEGIQSTIESESMRLRLRKGVPELEHLQTMDRGYLKQVYTSASGQDRTLEAERISMVFGNASKLEKLSALRDISLIQHTIGDKKPALKSWSDEMEASFDLDSGELVRLHQAGGFRFEEAQQGQADDAMFDIADNQLVLTGNAGISAQGSRITARKMKLNRISGRLVAERNVTSSMVQVADTETSGLPAGLFASNQPVYASADQLISDPENETLEYQGQARMWQKDFRIDADRVRLHLDSQLLTADGNVFVGWVEQEDSSSEQPARVAVRAGKLHYQGDKQTALFSEEIDFQRNGIRVQADAMQTLLAAETQESKLESVVASGSVTVDEPGNQSRQRGYGEQAVFQLADSEIMLTGKPARIVTPEGTETRGDSLTYRIEGDSLRVLRLGTERTYTYRPIAQ